MTNSDPLRQEVELQEQWRRASKAARMHNSEAHGLRTQLSQAERDHKAAMVEEARTGEEGASAKIAENISNLRRQIADTEARAEAAAVAAKQVEAEATVLRREHLDAFLARRLDPLTQRAIEKLAAVEAPLREAHQAYAELGSAWAPFHPALRQHVEEINAARGVLAPAAKVHDLCRLPTFPALDGFAIFDAIRAGFTFRPPALRVADAGPVEVFDASEKVS